MGGSATSTGLPEATGLGDATLLALASANSHLDYYDFRQRGYGVIEAKANELSCTLKAAKALIKGQPAVPIAKFRVAPGSPSSPERLPL